MNYHYFKDGEKEVRGFVRIAPVLRQDASLGYVPEIIGQNAFADTQLTDPDRLPRIITSSFEEASQTVERWANKKGYRLEKVD